MSRDPRRNPLKAKPPKHYHQLQNDARFRRVVGRAPTPEDYQGIHTTDSLSVAAAYAIASWVLRGQKQEDFPVVIRLNTTGIPAKPDVDAMLSGRDFYDAIRGEIQQELQRGKKVADLERWYEDYEHEAEVVALIGSDPAEIIFDEVQMYPGNPISLLLKHSKHPTPVEHFAATGDVPAGALSDVVRQRRYMQDFDIDRVVGIDAVQPWWPEIVNEDDEVAVEKIRDAGWDAITFEDAASGNIKPSVKTIYGNARGGESDYHGTTAGMVRKAFPGIRLAPGYQWTPQASVGVKLRGVDVGYDDEDF